MPAAQQAVAAPAAEEGVPDAGEDPETAPLVEPVQLEAVRVAVEDGADDAAESEAAAAAAKHAAAKEAAAKVVAETERAMEAWREAGPGPAATFPITVSSVTGSVEIEVTSQMSVGELQSVIEEKLGTGKDQQKLRLKDGPVLQDEQLVLGAAGAKRGATVRMGLIEAAEGAMRRELRAEARAEARKVALEAVEAARHAQEMALVASKNRKQWTVFGASLLAAGGVVAAVLAKDWVPRAEILLIEAVLLLLAVGWCLCGIGNGDAGDRIDHREVRAEAQREGQTKLQQQHRVDEKRAEANVLQNWCCCYVTLGFLAAVHFALVLPIVYDNTCWGYIATTRPSDYATTAYTLSGCSDPTHCGTFLRTDSTCDCAPVYQLPSAGGDGAFLYRHSWDGGSRWYVGLTPCTYWSNHYLQSGKTDTPRPPDHEEYSAIPRSTPPFRWERCTTEALHGEILGFTISAADLQRESGYDSTRGCDGIADDIDVVASDGADLCAGVDCGTGECRDGICTCTDGNFAGTRCEGNCADHGGATADGARCANCTGHSVGHICQRDCNCSGRGTQTDLPGARAAGSCYGGTCVDCTDNFAGALCGTSCGAHGNSTGSTCACEGDYHGESCQHRCDHGTFVTEAHGEFCRCHTDGCDGEWVGVACDVYESSCCCGDCGACGGCTIRRRRLTAPIVWDTPRKDFSSLESSAEQPSAVLSNYSLAKLGSKTTLLDESHLQHLVAPALAQIAFFERAIPLLQHATDESLLDHVHAYHAFLLGRARDDQLWPSFEVEVVWRAHLLSPIEYAEDCATILGVDEPTVLPHVPLPASAYSESPQPTPAQEALKTDPMPAAWYEDLVASTRRGTKFMRKVLALRYMGELSESTVAKTIERYLRFLRDVSRDDLEDGYHGPAVQPARVPGNLVDLVWHTHLLYPQEYSEDCLRIGGRVFDHVQDDEVDA